MKGGERKWLEVKGSSEAAATCALMCIEGKVVLGKEVVAAVQKTFTR